MTHPPLSQEVARQARQKFRKTALIEAAQWHQPGDHPAVILDGADQPHIKTLEGPMLVTPGDWIAGPGARGEFWAIKPDVFAATYESAALADKEAASPPGAPAPGWRLVPEEPTQEMIEAYLSANTAYWHRTDEQPTPPGKWRTGTPAEATAESLRAAIAASPTVQSPAPKEMPNG